MIGFWDYTVWLTYLSLISGMTGIFVSLHGEGHPYLGVFFLLFSGLCDSFDGMVARSKKDRPEMEGTFGVQIDSLADLVAFGVLPAAIGDGLLRSGPGVANLPKFGQIPRGECWITILAFAIMLFYVLAAMIRLAYFNVTEEERQKTEHGKRKEYVGLPVTSAALVYPTFLLLQYVLIIDITMVFFPVMLLMAFLFISKIRVPKPGFKSIMLMVGVGAAEFLLIFCFRYIFIFR